MTLTVDADTKLWQALKLHPDVLEYVVSLSPGDFERLYNPLWRLWRPRRLSLARVAEMAGRPVSEIVIKIHEIAALPLDAIDLAELHLQETHLAAELAPAGAPQKPAWAGREPDEVLDLLAAGERPVRDPIPPIFRVLNAAPPGTLLLVRTRREPQALYSAFLLRGIEHYAERRGLAEWWIYLRKPKNQE